MLKDVPVLELIAWRVLAGLPIMLLILWATNRHLQLLNILKQPGPLGMLAVSAILIGINWFVFIIAVDTDRLTEASLGYYINPLVSVALGMIFLGERMRALQWVAVIIAAIGNRPPENRTCGMIHAGARSLAVCALGAAAEVKWAMARASRVESTMVNQTAAYSATDRSGMRSVRPRMTSISAMPIDSTGARNVILDRM